jgi:hypothetical protein
MPQQTPAPTLYTHIGSASCHYTQTSCLYELPSLRKIAPFHWPSGHYAEVLVLRGVDSYYSIATWFIRFPWAVSMGDPYWVPPLIEEHLSVLNLSALFWHSA